MAAGQQYPPRLHKDVYRQRDECSTDKFERQAFPASFNPFELPNDNSGRKNFDGTIKPETDKGC